MCWATLLRPATVIAAELRISEVVAAVAAGLAGRAHGRVSSRGWAAWRRLEEGQLAWLEAVLDAGPLAAGVG
jgi:NhaP-type Na+/H+ or K+/H+ antiporter